MSSEFNFYDCFTQKQLEEVCDTFNTLFYLPPLYEEFLTPKIIGDCLCNLHRYCGSTPFIKLFNKMLDNVEITNPEIENNVVELFIENLMDWKTTQKALADEVDANLTIKGHFSSRLSSMVYNLEYHDWKEQTCLIWYIGGHYELIDAEVDEAVEFWWDNCPVRPQPSEEYLKELRKPDVANYNNCVKKLSAWYQRLQDEEDEEEDAYGEYNCIKGDIN